DLGISTSVFPAISALRMRVSISAIGSVIISTELLPARLGHAGDFSPQRHLAEADTAQPETADICPRATTSLATIAHPHFVFPFALAGNVRFPGHMLS